ncbi:IS3 family transposase [Lentilactobacillus hilgardii]|uniref:IS3 family transposase n=1 Tax=Lentilactobacillus hilgardii TaxID=1588 RepID=UPI0039E9FF62
MTKREIAQFILGLRDRFVLADILRALKFPKATYMYWQKRFNLGDPDKALEDQILLIHRQNPDYGYRRMTVALRGYGVLVNKKRIQRLMRKMGIHVKGYSTHVSEYRSTYHSYEGKVGFICKNRLKRRFQTPVCHQKITTDTTELVYFDLCIGEPATVHGLYLDVFLDMYNSEIISYRLSPVPNEQAILEGLDEAIRITDDCRYRRTFHSDQGWGYQSADYHRKLKQHRIFQSMSRKGTCLDNAIMENFFSILKREMYYGKTFHSYDELKTAIDRYLYYYNYQRIKEKLDWQSPVTYRLNASNRP